MSLNPNAQSFNPLEFTLANIFDTPQEYYQELNKKDNIPPHYPDAFETPKEFYQQLNVNAKPFVPVKQSVEDVFEIPEERPVEELPFEFRLKTSQGRKKVFNPNTSRWILDTSTNRKRILQKQTIKTKKKSQIKKKAVQFKSKPTIREYIPEFVDESESPQSPEYQQGLTLEACKKYSRNLSVDLSKVTPGRRSQKVVFQSDKQLESLFPGPIDYNGIPLKYITYISKGSYGTVFKYSSGKDVLPDGWTLKQSSKDPTQSYYVNESLGKSQFKRPTNYQTRHYEIAVKTYNDPLDTEIQLVNDLNKHGKNGVCNLINSTILNLNYKGKVSKVCAMDIMDGTLSNISNITSIDDKLSIISQLIEYFLCIKKNIGESINYTDLKCANVLYKCFKHKQMKLCIGDIGGLCNKWSGASTYPPPEFLDQKFMNCSESIVVWGLGVIFLELLNYDTKQVFYWKSARKMTQLEFMRTCVSEIDTIIDQYQLTNVFVNQIPVSTILINMLNPVVSDRFTLQQLNRAFTVGIPELIPPVSDSSEDGF